MQNEQLDQMLSAYLDGELTQQDSQRVRIHLENSPDARRQLEQLRTLQMATRSLAFPTPPDERLDALEQSLSVQGPRRLGWGLLAGGVVTLLLLVLVRLATLPDVPLYVKLILGAIGIGFALLLGSVARQRWLELPYDRYRGIKR
ncbi:MAG: hypothetical protein GC160_09230 [Acidobacteria bacterium]|nr:hypothetical protein [Acidobacteriota bacterium]